jgi:hypothetical protein
MSFGLTSCNLAVIALAETVQRKLSMGLRPMHRLHNLQKDIIKNDLHFSETTPLAR